MSYRATARRAVVHHPCGQLRSVRAARMEPSALLPMFEREFMVPDPVLPAFVLLVPVLLFIVPLLVPTVPVLLFIVPLLVPMVPVLLFMVPVAPVVPVPAPGRLSLPGRAPDSVVAAGMPGVRGVLAIGVVVLRGVVEGVVPVASFGRSVLGFALVPLLLLLPLLELLFWAIARPMLPARQAAAMGVMR